MEKTNISVLQSWGIASARHTSGVVLPREDGSTPGYFDVPQGPSLVRWDILRHKKLWAFQPHGDAVFCMRLSPDRRCIVTLSYGGEIGIWDTSYTCLYRGGAECSSLHHVSWSSDSGSIAMVGNGFDSRVLVYSLKAVGSGSNALSVVLEWQDQAGVVSKKHWGGRSAGTEVVKGQRFDAIPLSPAFETCKYLPSGCVVVTEDCPDGTANLLHLFSAVGKHLKLVELKPALAAHRLAVVLISDCCNGCFFVGLQGGHTLVFDDTSLDIKAQFCTEVTARTYAWDGGLLLFPTDSGKLVWWSTSGEKVAEVKVLEQDYYVRLAWDEAQRSLFVCGFTTLNHVTLEREGGSGKPVGAHITTFPCDGGSVEGVVRGFQIACCGLEFSPSSKHIAVGDLAGTVWVCSVQKDVPVATANVGMSVRCVVWLEDSSLLVGTLDGLLHRWNFERREEEPVIVQQLEGSVIHMRWAHKSKLLGLGTSKGKLHVFDLGSGEVCAVTEFTAHAAHGGKQDPLFGQLGKQAEIWSLCWSPSDDMLVTCSEDQTSKVWNTETWQLVTTLIGHTMAVTSVDWKQTGDKSVIATCSDDRTIRLVDGSSFQLMRTLNTKDVHGWFTLTYLTFEPNDGSSRLACATQNGHILVWDVLNGGQEVARGKVHCGSVEGLRWEGHCRTLVSCAADCNVHLFKID